MPLVRLFDLVVLVVLLLGCIRLVPSAFRIIQIYRGVSDRRLADGSAMAPPAPPAVALMAERLGRLGFERIGERTLVLPGEKRRFEWNLVDRDTTTYVAIVPTTPSLGGVLLACYSAFGDGAFVQTTWPRGATINRPDLLASTVATSPEDTLAMHVRNVAEFSRLHGQPLANRSMADLLARDATYRTRHGGVTLRGRAYGFVGLTALVMLATAFVIVRVVILDR
jgi:hypothetical protein